MVLVCTVFSVPKIFAIGGDPVGGGEHGSIPKRNRGLDLLYIGKIKNTALNEGVIPPTLAVLFGATQIYKPGSVLTAIYLAPQLLAGSSRLLEAVGSTCCFSTALLRDRVYSVKPMLPWAEQAMNLLFHLSCNAVVSLCCTCPEIALGGRYPLSLPYGARTFLIRGLSACVRGCPTWSRKYCTANKPKCQMSCKFF